ncbi:metallophosphoesterase family protein [Chloroflexota bacterium]
MRVGLLADTHIPDEAETIPKEAIEAFIGVDIILHAGDIYTRSVLDELQRIAPVLAAKGDDDYGAISGDARVSQKHTLCLEGHTLWLIHQTPYYHYISSVTRKAELDPDAPDIVIFGHEHRTIVQRHGHTLLVNPGSPTFLDYQRGLGTVGILELDAGEARAHIVKL